jgi:hypothetical protein
MNNSDRCNAEMHSALSIVTLFNTLVISIRSRDDSRFIAQCTFDKRIVNIRIEGGGSISRLNQQILIAQMYTITSSEHSLARGNRPLASLAQLLLCKLTIIHSGFGGL